MKRFALAAFVVVMPWWVAVPSALAQPDVEVTVDGVDYPVCTEEDCSDQPAQTGVWFSREGKAYLELGEDITIPITR